LDDVALPIVDTHHENGAELTTQLCSQQAKRCRTLASHTNKTRARVMLEHIAGTWERIAQALVEAD
jgi:hypothetical protein